MSVPRNRPIILPVPRGPFDYIENKKKLSAGQSRTLYGKFEWAPAERRRSDLNRTMTTVTRNGQPLGPEGPRTGMAS